jgi:hypothetical protein
MQFTSRSYFFYHFWSTSCLAFYASDMASTKASWADWYKRNVGLVPLVDRYIRLASPVPCMADGVPLVVEACLVRYMELRRLASDLDSLMKRRGFLNALLNRIRGATNLEKAVHRLEQLDLHQDGSVLWMIGGSYTDELFKYSAIRTRVERTMKNIQAIEAERARLVVQVLLLALTVSISIALKLLYG